MGMERFMVLSRSRRKREEEEEDMKYKRALQKLQTQLNSIGNCANMNETEFNDLFNLMLNSSDQVVFDVFEQMLVAGKIIFGEELGAIESDRRKIAETALQRHKDNVKKRDLAEESLQECRVTSAKIIERRENLLYRLKSVRTQYNKIDDSIRQDVNDLIISNHLKISMFGFLRVKSLKDIPTTAEMRKKEEKFRDLIYPSLYGMF